MKALDLFCGGGGASMGLSQAGYDVHGIDLYHQPKYPFAFTCADALGISLEGYDFVWASPVCKRFSTATRTSRTQTNWPDQIGAIRAKLKAWGGPWAIENVLTAPLVDPITLCGSMFGLRLYRHRNIETSTPIVAPMHTAHLWKTAKMGRPLMEGEIINPVGHFSDVLAAQAAMGIRWLGQKELSQAIPPAYAKYVAERLT